MQIVTALTKKCMSIFEAVYLGVNHIIFGDKMFFNSVFSSILKKYSYFVLGRNVVFN